MKHILTPLRIRRWCVRETPATSAHSDEFVANLLDELCTECVAQNVSREPNTPHSIPVMVSDVLSATVERPKKFLGTSAWVLGTVVVLAGHFLTII